MDDLTRPSVADFLNRVADRSPTPGGGSVTGAIGALASSLARMVAAYSVGPKTDPDVRGRVETAARHMHRLDQIMRALISQDAIAYAKMSAAAKGRGHKDAATPDSSSAYADAVLAAVAVPMEVAAVASQLLTTMDEFKAVANPRLLSDLGIAAVLAEAAARAARYTVRINACELADQKRQARILSDIDATVEHAESRRASIEAFIRDRERVKSQPSR